VSELGDEPRSRDHHTILHLPRPGVAARHAARHVVDGVVVPLALFYGGLQLLGLTGAVVAALVWGYGALAMRLVARKKVPGVLVVTLLTLTVRGVVSLATGSVFVYFLQPTLGTLLMAVVFVGSVLARRPLAQRLAHDFMPLPDGFARQPWVRRFFARISLLWAFVFVANFAVSLWLLVTQTLEMYLVVRTTMSLGLTGLAIAGSTALFVAMARWHDLRVAVGGRVLGKARPSAV
jgi:intracellular septation protein A